MPLPMSWCDRSSITSAKRASAADGSGGVKIPPNKDVNYKAPATTNPRAGALMQTILVVDDSPTIRRMVRASLNGAVPAAIVEATCGLDAIEALAVHSISAVVLDLNMPDMHGLDVLRFVRQHAQYAELPVLILTTRGDAAGRDEAMETGASAYMTKPFSPPALAQLVTNLLAPHVDAK